MISPLNYFYRFLDYILLQNTDVLRTRLSRLLGERWQKWMIWVLQNRDLCLASKSQVGQDLFAAYILEKEFGLDIRRHHGKFIEFGAFDGVLHSNSYLFEAYGWTGVLVEPSPSVAEQCRKNRKAQVFQACIVGNNFLDEEVLFNMIDEDGELSSIVGYGKSGVARLDANVIRVPTIHLDQLLRDIGDVDLLSIDTEGSELELLINSDLPKRPKLIIVEHNNNSKRQNRIRKIMRGKGYSIFFRSGDFFDDFFIDSKAGKPEC